MEYLRTNQVTQTLYSHESIMIITVTACEPLHSCAQSNVINPFVTAKPDGHHLVLSLHVNNLQPVSWKKKKKTTTTKKQWFFRLIQNICKIMVTIHFFLGKKTTVVSHLLSLKMEAWCEQQKKVLIRLKYMWLAREIISRLFPLNDRWTEAYWAGTNTSFYVYYLYHKCL